MTSPSKSGIRDNRSVRGSVADFLREKVVSGAELSFVSAYFTIYAYEQLKNALHRAAGLRFLFGEPSFIQGIDPLKKQQRQFRIENDRLELGNVLRQRQIAKDCADWISEKVEVRTVTREGFLHGKMYQVSNNGVIDAILGSSNFTVRGLGLAAENNNIELNLIVDSNRDREELKEWFEEIWNHATLVRDVKNEVLSYLEQLYQNNAPEFIYYKTLFHVFEHLLEDQGSLEDSLKKTSLFESGIWKALYDFQQDGVKGAISKLLSYNGCILADSVGLGKTFEALAIIKFFETRNEKVLVLCPKKLRENWTIYQAHTNNLLNPFPEDRFGYTLLHHTDLNRDRGDAGGIDLATFNWAAYDLVVIDESHNFRNNLRGKRDDEGNTIKPSRYERLMNDIVRSGVRTKVLLLSATPVNNTLTDLRNQISFIAGGDVARDPQADSAFADSIGIRSLKDSLRSAQAHFAAWARLPSDQRSIQNLLEKLGSDFFKLLDALTIARSRGHVERFYKKSLEKLGGFPKRTKPVSIYPELDTEKLFMSYDDLNDKISGYQLALFNPTKFVLPSYEPLYEATGSNFSQKDREHFLIGMMKVGFLKRLESSVHSFVLTLERTLEKLKDLEDRIRRFKEFEGENPEMDLGEIAPEEVDDEELRDALEVGKKLIFRMAHLDLDKWSDALHQDRRQLHEIYVAAKDIGPARDAKLAELRKKIAEKVRHPTKRADGKLNKKVLVFTAFADTAEYLHRNLLDWATEELGIHCALITGGGRNKTTLGDSDFNQILTNFSPGSKERHRLASLPQDEEIDLLIATDCISEGQNLQDCDMVVNYDIHWNPVRIIQRFGRIDRLKSPNKEIRLVNFWPTEHLDRYISLKHRVEARMALVDITTTADDNLLQDAPLKELISEQLRYRDRQLKKLQSEILEVDELNEQGVSLTEFTLDDFRRDLLRYLEENREILQNSPMGLYAVVPTDPKFVVISPGVIFCLRHEKALGQSADKSTVVNPLDPYFLVYVREDGNVRFSFAQPKQILEIMRQTCSGRIEPFEELCALFDRETEHGTEMDKYSSLLEKVRATIVQGFRRRAASVLQQDRSALLAPAEFQVNEESELELVTWLVISQAVAAEA